ncbi:MAG TPA: peptidase S41, partial [Planctomycetota bacterium]|nr:peptidase S41 [Planctomycetota bacterium]
MIAAMMAASVGATLSVDAFSASKSKLDRELNLFGEVIQQIQANYVDKPDDAKMMEGAINGMLAALDPHSSYMSQKEYERMSEEISGTFGGVGLEIQA